VLVFAAGIAGITLSASASIVAEGTVNGYDTHRFTEAGGASMTYYLHVPAGYDPAKRYPLVLLLHGGGESANLRGTPIANRAVLLTDAYVTVWTSPAVQSNWPSFIVVPQVAAPNRWVNVPANQGSYQLAPTPSDSLRLAKEIVDRGQLPLAMGEVLRGKALRLLTERVTVTDEAGRPVDITVATAQGDDDAQDGDAEGNDEGGEDATED